MHLSQVDLNLFVVLEAIYAQLLNPGLMNQVHLFPLHAPRLEAHLYWHESVENDPANRWLREEIEKILASAPGALRKGGSARRRNSQAA